MKLTHPMFSSPIVFNENRIPVLIIENPVIFRKMATQLIGQSESQEGPFVLSEDDCVLDCASHLNVFMDYIHLGDLAKRIQTKAIAALLKCTQEAMAKDTFNLSQTIQSYLGKLATLAEFPIAYEESENLTAILKAMDLHVDLSDLSAPEALYENMALIQSLSKNQCFVLLNAKAYFSSDELQKLYQMAHYRKINLLLMDSCAHIPLPSEEIRLFDADLCELHLDKSDELL